MAESGVGWLVGWLALSRYFIVPPVVDFFDAGSFVAHPAWPVKRPQVSPDRHLCPDLPHPPAQLLDVVREAVQVPLSVHLSASAQALRLAAVACVPA